MTAPARFDPTPLLGPARVAMVKLYRLRVGLQGITVTAVPSVSAIDLRAHLLHAGAPPDAKWSGAVFTAPRGLWRRIGYEPNPQRHNSPTPIFALVEDRAKELGL